MSVAKTIEISAESKKSFDDAINKGIKAACKSVNNVRSAWVKDQEVLVAGGKIDRYRVSLKVTFVLK